MSSITKAETCQKVVDTELRQMLLQANNPLQGVNSIVLGGAPYPKKRNSASVPEVGLPGRILAGPLPGKHRNRPSGRRKAGRRADFGTFPVAVRPKIRPECRFAARKRYCVT